MKLIRWIRSFDEKFWKDKLVRKSRLGEVSIMVSAISGALLTIVKGGIDGSFLPYILILILVNVVESILIAKSTNVAILRSLFMTLCLCVAMFAGIAVVVVAVVVLFVLLCGFIFSLVSGEGGEGGSSSGKEVTKDDKEVTEQKDLVGLEKSCESEQSDTKSDSSDDGNTATEE